MFSQFIRALLFLCGLGLCYYLFVWVLGALGIHFPEMVFRIVGVMFVLVAILILYRLFSPYFGGINWWGNRPRE